MAQCKARTSSGTQCKLPAKDVPASSAGAQSSNFCARHYKQWAGGDAVVNAQTGRKFPAPRAK